MNSLQQKWVRPAKSFLNILLYIFPLAEEKQKSLDDGKNKRKILEMEKENLMEVVRLKVKEIESRGKRILCSSKRNV